MSNTDWLGDQPPPIPENEEERIQALHNYEERGKEPEREEEFDRLARLAAEICGMPISLINLISQDNEFKKACFGYNGETSPRETSFCQFTIMQDEIFEVKDTHKEDPFKNHPSVTGPGNLRYYAGIPLQTPEGYNIGTLCLIDHKPNELTDSQRQALKILSDEIVSQFELKAARRKLEKNNKEKDELIQIISHDMRSPLMGILGFSELLKKEVEDSDQREILGYIEESGYALLGIVNVLLNSEYIKNEGFKINREEVEDVASLTQDIINLYKPSARLKSQEITINMEQPLTFKLDPEKWKQIVGNLLNNAIKFTPSAGTICLDLSTVEKKGKSHIKLVISDTGIGISPEDIDKLFSGKESIQREGTAGEKSSGLGMPRVKKYVNLHRGTVTVDSQPGEGTEITVLIPE